MSSHYSHKKGHAIGSKKDKSSPKKNATSDSVDENLDFTSHKQSTKGIQLGRWAFEVSNDKLTFVERLEKSAWEDTQSHWDVIGKSG